MSQKRHGTAVVEGAGFRVVLPHELGRRALAKAEGADVIYGIRPEHIRLAPDGEVEAEVYVVEPLGREVLLDCRLPDGKIIGVLVPADTEVKVGDKVRLKFDVAHSQLFDPKTELSLLWV